MFALLLPKNLPSIMSDMNTDKKGLGLLCPVSRVGCFAVDGAVELFVIE
jgi:hypothetical protein